MYKIVQHRLNQSWLPLLVNGSGMVLCGRAGWMIMAAPLTEGWVLFTNSAVLRDIVLFTGKSGLLFLVLSLACTPLARLLGWTPALQVRKALGLWGFGFACLHSLFFLQGKPLFIGWNVGPELWQAFQSMVGIVLYGSKVPYTEAGVYALLLLLPLALTSNRLAMRRLGKNWKRLHRLVYLAVPVAVYHYWWRTVTDFPVPAPPACGMGARAGSAAPPSRPGAKWAIFCPAGASFSALAAEIFFTSSAFFPSGAAFAALSSLAESAAFCSAGAAGPVAFAAILAASPTF